MAESPSQSPMPARPNQSALWHGLGLFGESYLLFSIGTLRPIWEALYPDCFSGEECRPWLTFKSLGYCVVLGVMVGMIVIGSIAGTVGRRSGSIITATLMSFGSILLTISSIFLSSSPSVLFPAMSLSLFIFGIGVGGEYPLSASSASERAMLNINNRRLEEKEELNEKMKIALNTPLKNNRLAQNAAKSDTNTNVNSWQTGENSGVGVRPSDNTNLTPIVESYGNESGGVGGVPHFDGSVTMSNNSLSSEKAKSLTRGREVLLVFSMQGMGIFANSFILTFLLVVSRNRGVDQEEENEEAQLNNFYSDDESLKANFNDASNSYQQSTLLNIWRITYATGAMILLYVLVSRIIHLTESEVWMNDRKMKEETKDSKNNREISERVGFQPPKLGDAECGSPVRPPKKWDELGNSPTLSSLTMKSDFEGLGSTNLDGCNIVPEIMMESESLKTSETMLLLRHFGVRLFGTSMAWLLWDIAFYGNKLFQSSFLVALTGENASLSDITCASAVNALVALLGYNVAAYIVDNPDVGRLTLQQTGFVITGTLFLLCACLSDRISSNWLVLMYFGSSFFGQCGPNCTTFLIPAEIFPTEMRTICHGISAASGKLGALIASILFNVVEEKDLFLFSGYASFAACLVTFLTIPDTTTLDLYEIDKQWRLIVTGEKFDYEGPAIDPKHLSFYERNQNKLCRSI
mmetsp:Transcript_25778/g.53363  ORF Transcript_25778/g.53363 Transcript_25778/m.53363 type:complete len:692 (+) Transcript_25778:136-2211(+)